MNDQIHLQLLLAMATLGVVLGVAAAQTNFCTLGALSDWLNFADLRRLRAWGLAMAVAILGVAALRQFGVLDLATTFPSYRSASFAWARHFLGGAMFGVGMVLASGCVSKTLLRLGAGNLKSLVVLPAIAAGAYLMNWTNLYASYFSPWLDGLRVDLAAMGFAGQGLDQLLSHDMPGNPWVSAATGSLIGATLIAWAMADREFRESRTTWLGAIIVGLVVVSGWWLSGGALGQQWREWAEFSDAPPLRMGVQSLTFVAPVGDAVRFLEGRLPWRAMSLGQAGIAGVLLGACAQALLTRQWRREWFRTKGDAVRHVVGGLLMGVGGVLAMGCTIGQGITGISTLALGSFVTVGAIALGAALTMRLQYRLL